MIIGAEEMPERFQTVLEVDAVMQIESNEKVMVTSAQRSGLSGISALYQSERASPFTMADQLGLVVSTFSLFLLLFLLLSFSLCLVCSRAWYRVIMTPPRRVQA